MDNRNRGCCFYSSTGLVTPGVDWRYNLATMFRNLIYAIVIIGVGLLVWLSGPSAFLPNAQGRAWVEIDPIQCGGNPWELWQQEQGVAYDKSEIDIIKDYYREQGTEVFEVKSKQTHEIVCEACSCPRGDTIYLLIGSQDVQKMLSLGYQISKS